MTLTNYADMELNNWRIGIIAVIAFAIVLCICLTIQSMHKKKRIGEAVLAGVKPYEARMIYKDNSVANDYAILIKAVQTGGDE